MPKHRAGNVTPAERRQAVQQDRDRAQVETLGIRAAQTIGAKAQAAAVRAYRRGADPAKTWRATFDAAQPLLTQGMVLGHLLGRRRSVLETASLSFRLPGGLAETPYDDAVLAMQRRLDLTPDQIAWLQEQYGAEALRVLKHVGDTVEKDLEAALLETTMQGEHVAGGVKALSEAFTRNGLTPDNSFSLEAIFRTQTQTAYGAGRWNACQDEAVQEILWGYKYVTVGDDRVRPEHMALDGTTLPKDDPFWNVNWPPNAWCCRCSTIPVFESRPVVRPPESITVDGREYQPGADPGFRNNPGQVFLDRTAAGQVP